MGAAARRHIDGAIDLVPERMATMRYLVLAALLLLSGCYYAPYGGYYYGGYPAPAPYPYAPYGAGAPAYPGPYAPPLQGPAYSYGNAPQLQRGIPGPLDPQNCGTPDEPKGCGGRG